jgi:hypothetical protein
MTVTAIRPTAPVLPPVGAFLATSWGYDQTNVEFYKIVGHTKSGKSVVLQPWVSQLDDESRGSCDYVVPGGRPAQVAEYEHYESEWGSGRRVTGYHDAGTFVHRARWSHDSDGTPTATTVAGHYARVWDGRPCYATATGWGH